MWGNIDAGTINSVLFKGERLKLRRVSIENVRSFLDRADLLVDGDISIVIGPNGGGKTNLLDTATAAIRRHLLTSWVSVKSPTLEMPERYELQTNETLRTLPLEPHSRGVGREQVIELEVEATQRDLDNILAMSASASEITERTQRRFIGSSIIEASSWDVSSIATAQRFTYRIVGNAMQAAETPGASLFLRYLSLYEVDTHLRSSLGLSRLSLPMVSMPVTRSSAAFQSLVTLANYNEHDNKRSVDAANSRNPGSLVNLAVGRLARNYRMLLERDSGNAREEFYAD